MATDSTRQLLDEALHGEPAAARALIEHLAPVVQLRLVRVLMACGGAAAGRDLRQETQDLSQEVFARLFADGGRLLRTWCPERGLSLRNFVGLIAQQHAVSVMRSRRRNPWADEPTDDVDGLPESEARADDGLEDLVASRQLLCEVVRRLTRSLSPLGKTMFDMLLLEDRPVDEICTATGLRPPAVYMWRSRLTQAARRIAADLKLENAGEARNPEKERAHG